MSGRALPHRRGELRSGIRALGRWALRVSFVVALLAMMLPGIPASAASNNVLFNGEFEGEMVRTSISSFVGLGWNPWFWQDPNGGSSREPEFGVLDGRQRHNGAKAQRWFNNFGIHNAGVWQTAKVQAGSYVTFSIWAFSWSSAKDVWGVSDSHYQKWVGIDTTGNTDPGSSTVFWSPVNVEMDKWVLLSVSTKAQTDTATVFVRGQPYHPVKHNDIVVDDAVLVYDLNQVPLAQDGSTPPVGTSNGAPPSTTPTPAPQPAANAPGLEGDSKTFDITNHTVKGEWLKWYESHGGLDNIGLPRSEVIVDPISGQWVQYFQRTVLEWHPENPPEYRILRRLLGDILYPGADAPLSSPPTEDDSYTFFAMSADAPTGLGHGVGDIASDGTEIGFATFFASHGGVDMFGFPKEEAQMRNGRWVQRFQAGVLEFHPENADPYRVQLELMGDNYIAANNLGFQ